ncbi:MAG: glutathione synthase [Planktomarina sp.]|jgi:glutathione synthase|nr:glutathione synthase [Planktomarina sp.]MDT2056709.1 glutathione synthase [Planktomarina sp.]MDT2072684.1 glutathione synthase [Planktomarina sp.]MDT2077246.1 glutathione synthase [Planktomarina sp.]HAJ85183.1 glutathione synthase [Paracoccaceae bacterium]|tara:strand:+ start:11653 stop:12591 length:939 start_codon:yes stop_codon:yes gene_type:complete
MSKKIAFQMDPIETVSIDGDSTFHLALEAQSRGYEIYYHTPDKLLFENGKVFAKGQKMVLRRELGNHVDLGELEHLDLHAFDVVWLRQDPPFDMGYITTTHLLDFLKSDTLVVNDPFWVRNYPEKLLMLQFPDLIPPTTIARDLDTLKTFRAIHGDVIVKPLYGNGGAGVFRLTPEDRNIASLHELFTSINSEPLIIQKFLPDVSNGDKRVILVDGDAVGAINRVPAAGETRSNMHVGGRPEKVGLTARDLEICAAIGPLLREKGQVFVGIDVIGDYLTEINVTSPTGLQELQRFNGTNVAGLLWDAIEAKL